MIELNLLIFEFIDISVRNLFHHKKDIIGCTMIMPPMNRYIPTLSIKNNCPWMPGYIVQYMLVHIIQYDDSYKVYLLPIYTYINMQTWKYFMDLSQVTCSSLRMSFL